VVNVARAMTCLPSVPVAWAFTVYAVEGFNGHVGRHVPSAPALPLTSFPLASATVTLVTLPSVTLTLIPVPGRTFLVPSAGVIDSLAAWACRCAAGGVLDPPEVHPAVSSSAAVNVLASMVRSSRIVDASISLINRHLWDESAY
jgi:hypothetical protein